ncbi:MAG: PAS domain S-box protein, partial [Candidatus Rokuibacteriota bacterium]
VQLGKRRRAQRAAAEARGHLRTVTATMREGVVAYDMKLHLSFVNPAFERLTGFPEEDLRDQEFLQFIHPDDRPALTAEWERLAQGGSLRDQEYRVVARGGQERWSSSSWEPLRDDSGRQIGYLGAEFDITERKLAEEAMRLDTELFQAIIEVQRAVGGAGLDSATVMRVIAEQSIRLTGAGGAVIETMQGDAFAPRVRVGVEVPASTGSVLSVPLQDEQQTLGLLKVMSAEANAFTDRDTKALRLLGGLMGAALGHAAAFEARQSRLEERTRALQESEQRFKQLVDAAQEGIWVADDRGMITYVNQRMAEMLGYQNGALLGRAVFDFLDPGSRAGAQRALGRAGGAGDSHDLRFRRKDGSELWGLVSASPILGRGGALVGTVGMVTDITERKRAEDRLRRSAERLAVLHDLDQAI